MTVRCDHGIRLDRYCGDCEAGFTFTEPDYHRANRRRARWIAALCFLALVVLVLGGTRHG